MIPIAPGFFMPSAVVTPSSATPGKASLILSAASPSVIRGYLSPVDKASLILTGVAPNIYRGELINVGSTSLTLTGIAPSFRSGRLINVNKGSLTITGSAPSYSKSITAPFVGFVVFGGGHPSASYYSLLKTEESGRYYDEFNNTDTSSGYCRYKLVNNSNVEYDDGTDEFTIPYFSVDDTWEILCFNRSIASDLCNFQIEFQESNGDPVAAIETSRNADYVMDVKYGASLSSLTNTASKSGYANPNGYLTFTDTQLQYTRWNTSDYTDSFTFDCDMASVAKVYVKIVNIGPLDRGYPYDVYGCFVNLGVV